MAEASGFGLLYAGALTSGIGIGSLLLIVLNVG